MLSGSQRKNCTWNAERRLNVPTGREPMAASRRKSVRRVDRV
jgi:hypothetical protein